MGFTPATGEMMKNDGTIVNVADMIEEMHNVMMSSKTYFGYSTDNKSAIVTNPLQGNSFIELDTKDTYFYDGEQWVVF